MHRRKVLILCLFIVLATFSASSLALAQTSPSFDLGCWGVLTTAGGQPQSPNFRVSFALGQVAAGVTDSATARLRIGYSQDWRTLQPTTPSPSLTPIPNALNIYVPVVHRYVRITRSCTR